MLDAINKNKGVIKTGGYVVGELRFSVLILGTIALVRAAFGV